MGIEIGAQLDALWRALFLGAAFALLSEQLHAELKGASGQKKARIAFDPDMQLIGMEIKKK